MNVSSLPSVAPETTEENENSVNQESSIEVIKEDGGIITQIVSK